MHNEYYVMECYDEEKTWNNDNNSNEKKIVLHSQEPWNI